MSRSGLVLLLAISPLLAAGRKHTTLLRDAPAAVTTMSAHVPDGAEARAAGAKLFQQRCAPCHGVSAAGIGKAPPLRSREMAAATPQALFWVLRNGSLRRGMPSFASLPESQRWQLIAYLQSLNPQIR